MHAPFSFESITFLAFTLLPLPPHLSNFVAHFGVCLTLAAWMIHGPLGFHSLRSISSLDWALYGCGAFLSYLAHVPFCPMSVGWLLLLSCHCTVPVMISLILLPHWYLWAYRLHCYRFLPFQPEWPEIFRTGMQTSTIIPPVPPQVKFQRISGYFGPSSQFQLRYKFWSVPDFDLKKKNQLIRPACTLGFFFSKFFHLISNINLTLPNDMLGRKEEKKKETREVDIRISDQYQMIC